MNMRRKSRSVWLKLTAWVLCLAGIGTAARTTASLMLSFYDTAVPLDKSELWEELDGALASASWQFRDESEMTADDRLQSLASVLSRYRIEYYINLDGCVITNSSVQPDIEHYKDSEWSFAAQRINGVYEAAENYYDPAAEEIISYAEANAVNYRFFIKLEDSFAEECEARMVFFRAALQHTIYVDIIAFLISLAAFIYLLITAGRRPEDDELHMLAVDRAYIEADICAAAVSGIAWLLAVLIPAEILFSDMEMKGAARDIITSVSVLEGGFIIGIALSMARNIKNRTFWDRSLIVRIFRKIRYAAGKVKRSVLQLCGSRAGIAAGAALAAYTLVIFICMLLAVDREGLFVPIIIVLFCAAIYFISKKLREFDKLQRGIYEIRNGNIGYKITDCGEGILGELAQAVNSIGDGMSASVERQIKAERMKTELITNVSHDLKTPLTSIINYADLLCKEKLEPAEANDYAEIIRRKADRLKNLTADLFDISRIQSGNEIIRTETLDLTTLIRQTLGELNHMTEESGLDFQVSLTEGISCIGDGKKLSRVFENLIVNTLKYSLPGTRVYISSKQAEGCAAVEIKNIASYKMEFDGEEITERFVRGEKSRTTEGSGLGLAIAKSYTEACGGSLAVTVDGDLFKVTVKLKTEK